MHFEIGGKSVSPSELSKYTVIAIMGVTGSGKTTFVNQISKSQLEIGDDLESCTSDIQISEVFSLEDRQVVLIDTPGFDDTNKSDTDVLKLIAGFMGATYSAGVKLAGILYVHRISDDKFGGMASKNLRMFKELCGEKTLKNIIFVTTMWDRVDPEQGAAREQQLRDKYFRAAVEKGAQMCRHNNTPESAQEILRKIIRNQPAVLKIQQEMVDEGKDIGQTGAGTELNREISELMRIHKREIRELKESLQKAIKDKDEEYRRELEKEKAEAQEKIERLQRDSEEMKKTIGDLKEEMDGMWKCVIQ